MSASASEQAGDWSRDGVVTMLITVSAISVVALIGMACFAWRRCQQTRVQRKRPKEAKLDQAHQGDQNEEPDQRTWHDKRKFSKAVGQKLNKMRSSLHGGRMPEQKLSLSKHDSASMIDVEEGQLELVSQPWCPHEGSDVSNPCGMGGAHVCSRAPATYSGHCANAAAQLIRCNRRTPIRRSTATAATARESGWTE